MRSSRCRYLPKSTRRSLPVDLLSREYTAHIPPRAHKCARDDLRAQGHWGMIRKRLGVNAMPHNMPSYRPCRRDRPCDESEQCVAEQAGKAWASVELRHGPCCMRCPVMLDVYGTCHVACSMPRRRGARCRSSGRLPTSTWSHSAIQACLSHRAHACCSR
jgi:hypothetical protein